MELLLVKQLHVFLLLLVLPPGMYVLCLCVTLEAPHTNS